MEKDQKRRRSRLSRDSIDSALIELLSFYRDVLLAQSAPETEPINADMAQDIADMARLGTAESTMRHIDVIVECRESMAWNAASLLALERMMIGLRN